MLDDWRSNGPAKRSRWVCIRPTGRNGKAKDLPYRSPQSLGGFQPTPSLDQLQNPQNLRSGDLCNRARAEMRPSKRQQPFNLGERRLRLPLHAFLFEEFVSQPVEGVRGRLGLSGLLQLADQGWVLSRAEQPLRIIAGGTCVSQAGRRIDADSESLLHAVVTVGEPPTSRSVGHHPELKAAAVGQLRQRCARLHVANLAVGQSHVGISPGASDRYQQLYQLSQRDTNRRPGTVLDDNFRSSY
jgi:hypothetical protein